MKYVAYYRVSTKQQGKSGLGLEAQKKAVQDFVKCENCIIGEYVEVESGKRNDRTELAKAFEAAKVSGSVLIVAKLDRLSRNASFLMSLRDSGVEFRCVDMPDLNTLTLGVFASLAQHERELTSARTKAALQAKKAQGATLGNPQNLTDEARKLGRLARTEKASANPNNTRARAFATSLNDLGISLRGIARRLNESGFKTSTGREFQAVQVSRLLAK